MNAFNAVSGSLSRKDFLHRVDVAIDLDIGQLSDGWLSCLLVIFAKLLGDCRRRRSE